MKATGSRAGWLGVPAVALAATLVYLAGGFEWADRHLLDLRFSLLSRPASGQVVVVSIDPESLAALDVWPWPRSYHATVLDNLLAAGARRVAFDVDFSSRSIEEEDRVFAESLQSAGARALLPIFQQWEGAGTDDGFVQTKPLAIFSPPAALATINIQPESDGLVRRYGRQTAPAGSPPPLAMALAGATGIPADGFEIDYGIEVPGIPRLSYVQALTGAFEESRVAGRDVIVGATALELGDQSAVPVHAVLSGPLLQALAYESIVGGRALVRLSPVWLCGLILLLALAAGRPVQTLSWRAGLALSLAVMGALFALAAVVQRANPIIVEIAAPCAAMAGWYGLSLTRRLDHQELRLWMAALTSRRTELKMRHVVENSGEAIVTLDETGRIQTFNRAAERLFGRASESMLGVPFTQLATQAELLWSTGRSRQQFEIDRLDGERRVIDMVLSDPGLDGQPVRVAFLRDITESCAQRVALEHQATHDVLTDLPNRTLLSRCLDEALTAGEGGERQAAALLMLDLDRFKEVNDTLGHTVGDLLLREIAGRLSESVGDGVTIARLGGDEFAILVPAAGSVEAEREARRLIEALSRPFMVQGMPLQIDGSVGIALHPRDGREAGVLLQRADVAMYQAKRQRNTFRFYDSEADECSLRNLTLKGEMREAIDRDFFQLHYQPKVRLSTGEASGVEGLLRWRHARHGWLRPLEFIPLAERTGLIGPLTHWVLREAVAQSARWSALGLTLRVSVNCSARNLLERDLPATVERLLKGANVDPSLLVLEITETAVIEEPDRSLQVLRDVASLGVGLSIDDFGSAYASLDYLRKLPAAELKIDGSFIRSLDTDQACAAIVKATIGLAHDFGLKAVAEGIETPEVLDMLRELGCDEAQGYYIAHPMPAAAIPDWVAARAGAPVPARMERAGHTAGALQIEPA